uniref:Uncharacterized protein n=1 Tax=Caenorhabditis tropicalis TaxID=1561998 RepID=A0A1I7U8T6_9PELO
MGIDWERWAVSRCRRWGRFDGTATRRRRMVEVQRPGGSDDDDDGKNSDQEAAQGEKELQKDNQKSGFRRIGCPRATATRPVILEPGFPSRSVKRKGRIVWTWRT